MHFNAGQPKLLQTDGQKFKLLCGTLLQTGTTKMTSYVTNTDSDQLVYLTFNTNSSVNLINLVVKEIGVSKKITEKYDAD